MPPFVTQILHYNRRQHIRSHCLYYFSPSCHPVWMEPDLICSSEVWKVHVLIFLPFSDIIAYTCTNSRYLPPIISPCIGRILMWFEVWIVNTLVFFPIFRHHWGGWSIKTTTALSGSGWVCWRCVCSSSSWGCLHNHKLPEEVPHGGREPCSSVSLPSLQSVILK